MNKSDKYYLKKGKLELSMLDDEEDEDKQPEKAASSHTSKVSRQEEMLKNLNLQHTKRLKEEKKPGQPKVKVSKEIYNTLHVMGQYLTKNEESNTKSLPVKKPVNSAKAQLLEQLASTVQVKNMELPPLPSREERMKNVSISRADEIKEVSREIHFEDQEEKSTPVRKKIFYPYRPEEEEQPHKKQARPEFQQMSGDESVHLPSTKEEEKQRAGANLGNKESHVVKSQAHDIKYNMQMDKEVEQSYEQIAANNNSGSRAGEMMHEAKLPQPKEVPEVIEEFEDEQCVQRKVDALVGSFFDKRVPQYSFTKDLKRHIDKCIQLIREQQ